MEDYYKILGVDRQADPETIKKAYKKLAMTHHPDRGGDPDQFRKITEAYEQLTNPQPQKDPSLYWDDAFAQRMYHHMRKAHAARVVVRIPLDRLCDPSPLMVNIGQTICSITIPPGIENGDKVMYHGIGPEGNDVVVIFAVLAHPRFVKNGLDLTVTEAVSVLDLIVGTTITVVDIRGRQYKLNIPPLTPDGKQFRMPNLGLQGPHSTGSMIVKVKSIMPKTITDDLRQAILNEVQLKEETDVDPL